jgi:mRNA interferase MazF
MATYNQFDVLDISIDDLQGAGLRSPSIIRMKLFTLEDRSIVRKIGALSKNNCAKVEMALTRLFGAR